jgi:probable rRNA maturation factor
MIQVNLYIGSRYPVDRYKLREVAQRVLKEHKVFHAELDISVVGARKMTELNETMLKHDGPTDVLSFPTHERHQLNDFPLPAGMPPHLGDIFISFPEAVKTAKKMGRRVDNQLIFYLEHGMLHILGYHHE